MKHCACSFTKFIAAALFVRTGICVFVTVLFIPANTIAQSTFVRMYNQGNMAYTVREVNGNSYVAAGGTDFYYNFHWFIQSPINNTNIHLLKTDANGVLLWERVISKPNTRMIARWMEPTLDGGFILTGAANQDLVWPPDSNDVVLLKTNSTGMVSWCKYFDTGKDEIGYCVQQTADSGYIISGFHDALPVSLALTTYILLIKTDALGNIQWEKKYQFAVRDFNTHESFSYVVKQTANGGYIVTGTNAVAHPADAEVLRTDAAGNMVWAKTYQHDNSFFRNSTGLDIIETSTGDFLIAGSMDKESPLYINYPYFLRINNSGDVLKQRFFETLPVLNFQSGFSSVQETSDAGFFFTGMGGYSDFGDQAQLLKTLNNLNMTWSRVYTWDGLATVGSMSGRQTSDGGYVFAGKHQMDGAILMKTNSVGMIACKVPNSLIEYTPSVTVSDWAPVVTSGINSNSILLTVNSPLVDTTLLCPVSVPSLPVTLGFFQAIALPERKVRLDWLTQTETNNEWFVVEKSPDNTHFEEAVRIAGAGNSVTTLRYSTQDESPYPIPVSYYRLRQIDFDGRSTVTASVSVKFRYDELSVFAFADKEQQLISISFSLNVERNLHYKLYNILGEAVASGVFPAQSGDSRLELNMSNQSNGIYFFNLNNGSDAIVTKVVY